MDPMGFHHRPGSRDTPGARAGVKYNARGCRTSEILRDPKARLVRGVMKIHDLL